MVGVGYGGVVVFWMVYLYLKLVEKVVFVVIGMYMMFMLYKLLFVEFGYDDVLELLLLMIVKGLWNFVFVVIYKLVYKLLKFVCKDVLDVSVILNYMLLYSS